MGARSSGPGYKGELDDFQLYSTELTEEQVAEMYANPGSLAPFGPGAPFVVTSITSAKNPVAGTDVTITWNSKRGELYALDFLSTSTGAWVEVEDSIEGDEGATTSHTVTETEVGKQIYRVRRAE